MALEIFLPPDYYAAQLFFTGTSAPSGAAITFGGHATFVDSTPAAIAALIVTAWGTRIDPEIVNTLTLATVRVKKGPMEDGPFAQVTANNAGASSGTAGPPSVAFLIRKNTAFGGKKGAGRMYLPGVKETDVDETGAVVAGKVTLLQTAFNGFLNDLAAANAHMHLLHSYGSYTSSKGVVTVVPSRTPDQVTSLAVDNRVATQRRRLRR